MTPSSDESPASTRILTVPNVLSFARLLGVPVFLWLILVPEADGWAFCLLAVAGASDWVDGYLARRLDQRSELGVILDPLADRLYIAATLLGLALRELIPWWLVGILVARELFLLDAAAPDPAQRSPRASRDLRRQERDLLPPVGLPAAAAGRASDVRRRGPRLRLGVRALGHLPLLVGGLTLRTAGVRASRAGVTTGMQCRQW